MVIIIFDVAGNGPAMSPMSMGSPVGSPDGLDETVDPPMPGNS